MNSLAVFAFFFLLGAYPFVSFLWRRSYPVLTSEVAVVLLLVSVFSILFSLLHLRFGAVVTALLTSLLITVVLLIQFDLRLVSALPCLVLGILLVWRLRSRFFIYGIPVLAAMLLGALFDSSQDGTSPASRGQAADTSLPPVIHIVLDSFIGLDGLPPYPASALMKEEALKFFEDFGFRVFPSAYSRYSRTADSLFSAMNFRNDGAGIFRPETWVNREQFLASNAYFDALEDLGYRLNIYQTEYLDYCRSNPANLDRCWNYPHPNVSTVRQIPGSLTRAVLLAKVLLTQSTAITAVAKGRLSDPAIAVHDPRVLETLQHDILDESGGRAFLAHALIPHSPFVYLHDCAVRYETDASLSYSMIRGESNLDPAVYEYRALRYFEQTECALLSLRRLFDEMKSGGIFNRSFIVLHGDHGSLIGKHFPEAWNLEKFTGEDFRAQFSTLFAVRTPEGDFGVDRRVLPLSVLLEEFSNSVAAYAQGKNMSVAFMEELPEDPEKVAPYVYFIGTARLERVDVNIFDE